MIKVEHVSKKYRRLYALDDVSAQFKMGQAISLIGPNGSGKTTLIKSILGMVRPDHGEIYFDNVSIRNENIYRSRIGYMPQIGRYPDNMKVGQVINMIKNIRKQLHTDNELYDQFDIESISNKSMRSLSGGMRQKVSATLAFLFNPDVLILDEPTAGLDPVASEILKSKILEEKRKGKLILITSHVLSDLEDLTTDLIYLQDGRVHYSDTLSNIKMQTGEIRLTKAIAALMKNDFRMGAFQGTALKN